VYVLQDIERSEVPSLGLAQLIRHGLLDMNDLPLDRRRSVLAKPLAPPAAGAVGHLDEAVVNIIFIVRTDTFTGRIILNHKELYKAVEKLAKAFPKRFADQRKDQPALPKRLRIELAEHVGSVSLVESRKLFGRADIVIGPHGAGTPISYLLLYSSLVRDLAPYSLPFALGFAHLYAARTGAHVLEVPPAAPTWCLIANVYGANNSNSVIHRTTSQHLHMRSARAGLPRHLPQPHQ
jgi:hypothetical protein